jgi:hypothetical protein
MGEVNKGNKLNRNSWMIAAKDFEALIINSKNEANENTECNYLSCNIHIY